jgi:hypothetical protein
MLERRRFQEAHLTELADHMPWPRVELPYLFRERFDLSAITLLADTLVSQLQALEGKAA